MERRSKREKELMDEASREAQERVDRECFLYLI